MQPVDVTECTEDANYLWESELLPGLAFKVELHLKYNPKMTLPPRSFLLYDIFSLGNRSLCSDSPLGFLLIAAVVAEVGVRGIQEPRMSRACFAPSLCRRRAQGAAFPSTWVKIMFFKVPPRATPSWECAVAADTVGQSLARVLTEAGQNSNYNYRAGTNVSEQLKTQSSASHFAVILLSKGKYSCKMLECIF